MNKKWSYHYGSRASRQTPLVAAKQYDKVAWKDMEFNSV